jgi:hypothetical protein
MLKSPLINSKHRVLIKIPMDPIFTADYISHVLAAKMCINFYEQSTMYIKFFMVLIENKAYPTR